METLMNDNHNEGKNYLMKGAFIYLNKFQQNARDKFEASSDMLKQATEIIENLNKMSRNFLNIKVYNYD